MLRVVTQSGSVWHVDTLNCTFIRLTRGKDAGGLRGDATVIHYDQHQFSHDEVGSYLDFICDSPRGGGVKRNVSSSYISTIDFIATPDQQFRHKQLQANNPSPQRV